MTTLKVTVIILETYEHDKPNNTHTILGTNYKPLLLMVRDKWITDNSISNGYRIYIIKHSLFNMRKTERMKLTESIDTLPSISEMRDELDSINKLSREAYKESKKIESLHALYLSRV